MNDEKLRKQIGANIVSYRKRNGLTQAGLAEKLNYSDKAVSKWERGDSLPDVMTLVQLAELFDITVNDLLVDPDAVPVEGDPVTRVVEKALKRKPNKSIILKLCTVLVWFVAVLFFAVLSTFDVPKSWLGFVYAVPVNAIVLLVMRSVWRDFRWNRILVSTIMWGSAVSIYVTLLAFTPLNFWKIFLLGIPGQIAIILWSRLFRSSNKENDHGEE